jgi:hypothetical protein
MVTMKRKEPAETIKCTVTLPVDLWRAARVRALDERRDFKDVVADALELYLKRSQKGGTKP